MNFSVHLKDELVSELNRVAAASGRTRNAVVREAVVEWLTRRKPVEWPPEVADFRGVKGAIRFENERRRGLKPPREPFDALSA